MKSVRNWWHPKDHTFNKYNKTLYNVNCLLHKFNYVCYNFKYFLYSSHDLISDMKVDISN